MQLFAHIHSVLAFYGLSQKKRLRSSATFVLFQCLMCFYMMSLSISKFDAYFTEYFTYVLTISITAFVMKLMTTRVAELSSQLDKSVCSEFRTRMLKRSRILVTVVLIKAVIEAIGYAFYAQVGDMDFMYYQAMINSKFWRQITHTLRILGYCYMDIFYNLTLVIYYLVLMVVRELNENFFAETIRSSRHARKVLLQWMLVVKLRNCVDDTFNYLPFIWCVDLFLKSTLYVQSFREISAYSVYSLIEMFYNFTVDYIKFVLPLPLIQRINDDNHTKLAHFKLSLLKSVPGDSLLSDDWEALLSYIERSYKLQLSGWRMFTYDKRFILSFVLALISYSVLSMQIQ